MENMYFFELLPSCVIIEHIMTVRKPHRQCESNKVQDKLIKGYANMDNVVDFDRRNNL